MLLKKSKIMLIGSILLSFVIITSCGNDDDSGAITPIDDVLEVAETNSDLSTLVEAIKIARLDRTLASLGPFTLFAPSNSAFQALLDTNQDWNSLEDIPVETLRAVLDYHIVAIEAPSSSLSDGQKINTLRGGHLTVDTSSGVQILTNDDVASTVTSADVEADNGVIHIIDKILIPTSKTILDKASDEGLTSFLAAVDQAGLRDALLDGTFTVFAPTNDAFDALIANNAQWNSLADIDNDTLEDVLRYHVVNGKAISTTLTDAQELITILGETNTLRVGTTNGVTLTTNDNVTVNVTDADIEGTNGVIHVIDAVMLPTN